ncbi:carbohydrate-selective porin OprB [Nostoc commune NIES-4072]|uniref:Carbohydrate-selective porin OprB n=1 Tax=Nostoc commune NIES-4072 TaxID=2005467 RepID=A0A2R5FXM9_NOSCO|nr:iron uptake porin [Nostoc commune]BBD66798.1 carbohydrate-selective porin OprB [Nostoc commune HK-02]GBG22218.1 carbohydrate-selective porin OprB [Nostoc commune NIES-4072]
MKKAFWNLCKVSPVVLAAAFFAANSAVAAEVNEQVTNVAQLSEAQDYNNMSQVTSVSQFSDVQPTDWAFQALQSLVERYGCIAGYPNSTYRGNRALTRYEFAAGLNSCLDRVNELIATATADLVTKQDLTTLQRLQEEFSAELATLRGRVDGLEARTAELEANQFSTTTKLVGEGIFAVSDVFGNSRALPGGSTAARTDLNSNTTFSDRVRLNLYSSFTGTDQLQIRLNAGNIVNNAGVSGTNMTRLGFDVSDATNSVAIDKINYAFNFANALRVKVDASGGELYENVNTFNPDFASSGRGALSRYGRFSPIYRQGQNGAGLTVTFNPGGPLSLTGAYLAQSTNNGNIVNGFGANNPGLNNGLFNGDNTIFGQLSFQPSKAFNIGLTYARSYFAGNGANNLFQSTGSAFANNPFVAPGTTTRTESNNYGVEATFQFSPKLAISGWGGYTTADARSGGNAGADADIWYWAGALALKDFGGEGNVLGVIFGQPPKVTGGSIKNVAGNTNLDDSTSYHLEGLYKFKVSDNIQITPGLLVIFNPEHNDANDTEYVGTLRTTFTF